MEFTFDDGNRLCSLLSRQQTLVDKKRRYLASMIPKPDGSYRRVKRPKFLNVRYLSESHVRSEESSLEKVRASIDKSLRSECNDYAHHLVQDGLRLFDIQRKENEPLGPESLDIMHQTVRKLNYKALQSVACIVSHNKFSFDKTRPVLEKVVKSHLPSYLTTLDNKDIICQLSNIFTNPCSYRSDSVSLVTPISAQLLSAISYVLDSLDGMSMQAVIAVYRKLREKSCTPKYGLVVRSSKKGHTVKMVRKNCNRILTALKQGDYLPKNLAKAISVVNLYRKQKLKSLEISQSEFFPFTKETIYLQNNILNALWSLERLKHDKLKLLRPILDPDSKVQRMHLNIALRNYLTDCLFQCDEAALPDEALQAIAFINRISRRQVIATEERKEVEVDAVLNLSSHLRALAHCCIEECTCGEELISLGNDSYNEDNDFVLSGTNYFTLSSKQQQVHEPSCSNNIPGTSVMRECWGETVGSTHNELRAEDESERVHRKPCERTADSGGTGHNNVNEAVDSGMDHNAEKSVGANHLSKSKCSEISRICDETAIAAHKIIGQILDKLLLDENNEDKWLLGENNEVDRPSNRHHEEGLASGGPHDDSESPNSTENRECDILIQAVQSVLPDLPKSCIDRVKRIMD